MDPSDAGYYEAPNYLTTAKVDPKNFQLGGDPNWVSNFAQGQQGVSAAAASSQQDAQKLRNQGDKLEDQAAAAGNRGGPTANYSQAGQTLLDSQQRAQQGVNQTGQRQGDLATQLQGFAAAPAGPSAAQAQLTQGKNDALNAQLAMARSGSGFGESAAALDSASRGAASTIASAANQSAQTAAQEDQARRAQQLQALGQSGQALASEQQGQLGQASALSQIAGQQGEQQEFNANLGLQSRNANDQMQLGLSGQSLQGQEAALQAENQSQNTDLASQQLTLGANAQQLQAQEQEEQLNAQLYGTDSQTYGAQLQNQVANRNLDQQLGRDVVGGVGSAIGAIGSLAALSDRRAKRSVRLARLDEVYRALTEAE